MNGKDRFKYSTIVFQGQSFYVIEDLEFGGEYYIYTLNVDDISNAKAKFLKREALDFSMVTEQSLINKLLIEVGKKAASDIAKELKRIKNL